MKYGDWVVPFAWFTSLAFLGLIGAAGALVLLAALDRREAR